MFSDRKRGVQKKNTRVGEGDEVPVASRQLDVGAEVGSWGDTHPCFGGTNWGYSFLISA